MIISVKITQIECMMETSNGENGDFLASKTNGNQGNFAAWDQQDTEDLHPADSSASESSGEV